MASQITGVPTTYTTVCSGANQGKHLSSASLAFVSRIHQWPMDSPLTKGQWRGKRFHLMTSSFMPNQGMVYTLLSHRKKSGPNVDLRTLESWQTYFAHTITGWHIYKVSSRFLTEMPGEYTCCSPPVVNVCMHILFYIVSRVQILIYTNNNYSYLNYDLDSNKQRYSEAIV